MFIYRPNPQTTHDVDGLRWREKRVYNSEYSDGFAATATLSIWGRCVHRDKMGTLRCGDRVAGTLELLGTLWT